MRFEIHETVQTPDPEVVLRALEMCSREVSSDVVRFGDRITLRGLGPSPRSKNKHDTTVFCVNAENNETVIQVEVNFQASALLGETSQQEVVRSKLDDLFEQMKAQIQVDSLRVVAYAAARKSAVASTAVADRPEEARTVELRELEPPEEKKTASSVAPETLMEAMTAAPDSGWGAAALVAEPQKVTQPDRRAEFSYRRIAEPNDDVARIEHRPAGVKDGPERAIFSAETVESERPKEAEEPLAKEKVSDSTSAVGSEHAEEPTWAARTPPYRLRVEEVRTSGWKRFALWTTALVILLALAGGAYFLYWSRRDLPVSPASVAAKSFPIRANPLPKLDTKPSPKPDTTKPPETSPATKAPSPDSSVESATSNPDLKLWLQSWGASMRTKDASTQAAFYADTVDRYLNQRKVGRGAVLRDREATIRMRKGLWTVKMEDIVIERQTSSEAEVRLVKHFIDQPEPSEILESFVPTRLTLKRMDGQWKITSEQDLPALSITPWKSKG
jgi:ketosteroid isomerase-like protein